MATFHCQARRLQRSEGHSASGNAAYRADLDLTDPWDGRRYNQENRHPGEDVEHFFVAPDGFDVAQDIGKFFAAVDAHERRKDATLGKEFEVALPAELDRVAARDVAQRFAQRFADENRVASVAIHWKDGNPHAHVWASDRPWSPEKGWGDKVKKWDQPAHLKATREAFADLQNQAYERAGFDVRVDHRSHKDRGIEHEPERHEGRAPSEEILEHNRRIARGTKQRAKRAHMDAGQSEHEANKEATKVRAELEKLEREADAEAEKFKRPHPADLVAAAQQKRATPEPAPFPQGAHPAERHVRPPSLENAFRQSAPKPTPAKPKEDLDDVAAEAKRQYEIAEAAKPKPHPADAIRKATETPWAKTTELER